MNKDNLDDRLDLWDDDALEELYDLCVEQYADTPNPVTPELDAEMEAKFETLRKRELRTRHRKKVGYVAAVLILTLGFSGFAVMQTEAWQNTIEHFRITFIDTPAPENESQFSDSDLEKLAALPDHTPYPIDMPDGYSIDLVDPGNTRTEIVYMKPDSPNINYMIFYNDSPEFNQKSLQKDAIKIKINNWEGFAIKHSQKTELFWNTHTHIFKISGCVDENILLEMARSVK